MLIRGPSTEDRIRQIAEGFKSGIDNYSAGQRRQNDFLREESRIAEAKSLQEEARKRQEALQSVELANSMSEKTGKLVTPDVVAPMIKTGDYSGLGEYLKTAPASKKSQMEEQKFLSDEAVKQSIINRNNRKATNPAPTYEQKLEKQYQFNKQKKVEEANIPDFQIASPDVIPSSKDAEEVKKLNASNKSFQAIGTRVMDRTQNADPRNPKYYLSNDWRLLQQDLTEMKLQAKNLADLGVLNGPDLSLVNETLGSLTPTNLALLGPEKAAERIKQALETSNAKLMNAASSRGYKPKMSQEEMELAELAQLRAKAGG